MTNWKKFEGTDEQIAEMLVATERHGVILRDHTGAQIPCIFIYRRDLEEHLDPRSKYPPSEYLVCERHPLAGMVSLQAQTGQPVYFRLKENHKVTGLCYQFHAPCQWPDNYEYSFTPFEEPEELNEEEWDRLREVIDED